MKSMIVRGLSALLIFTFVTSFTPASAEARLTSSAVRNAFALIAKSPTLAHPSIILIDRADGSVVYEKDSTSARKPASVMKLLSATATLEYLNPNARYTTRVLLGSDSRTVVMRGDFDPWMTSSYFAAKSDHRVWLHYLANKTLSRIRAEKWGGGKSVKILYYGFYPSDVTIFRADLRRNGVPTTVAAVSKNAVENLGNSVLATATSPTIGEMLKYALLWSDNLLAERLARAAAHAAGYKMNDAGVAEAFRAILANFQVDPTGFFAKDGSGLSHHDRVTAKIIGELLLKTRDSEKFSPIFGDLPVAGISGTLENRFITTAPQAIGLIRAKTGTLSGTVSLAGYIESGQHEYIFVIIADQIPHGLLAEDRARATIDRILGKIAYPKS